MATFWYEEWHIRPRKPDPWGEFLKGAGAVFLALVGLGVLLSSCSNTINTVHGPAATTQQLPPAERERK